MVSRHIKNWLMKHFSQPSFAATMKSKPKPTMAELTMAWQKTSAQWLYTSAQLGNPSSSTMTPHSPTTKVKRDSSTAKTTEHEGAGRQVSLAHLRTSWCTAARPNSQVQPATMMARQTRQMSSATLRNSAHILVQPERAQRSSRSSTSLPAPSLQWMYTSTPTGTKKAPQQSASRAEDRRARASCPARPAPPNSELCSLSSAVCGVRQSIGGCEQQLADDAPPRRSSAHEHVDRESGQ
mmetsp:Transcript_83339/g.244343  ORF Transcript_83339/g.244343 Transcript_83339/m.244343 type:complete len:238 (-) Transcript_83339:35-748(-)